jgi:hypothetical protein
MLVILKKENNLLLIIVNIMGIEQICKTISNFFSNVRPPFPQLSRLLLVCSMIRRPGLSVIQSVANITKDLNKLGIPTGSMPDGSANLTIGFTCANTKEIYRALKKDASIQVGFQPGSLNIVGQGTATNINAGMGFGKAD